MLISLHTHSIFSDGELLPSELARRCEREGYRYLAITDHADSSNIEDIIKNVTRAVEDFNRTSKLKVLPGVEITHVDPTLIAGLTSKARTLGAKVVVVHGETITEPVKKGTNLAAIQARVDILAHPGLISKSEMELAKKNNVLIEITTRKGHSLTNGHVAQLALECGTPMVLNTDAHTPSDIISRAFGMKVALGAGLSKKQAESLLKNSEKFAKRNFGLM